MFKDDFYKKYVVKEGDSEKILKGRYEDYQAFLILEKLSNLKMPSLLKGLILQLTERDYSHLEIVIDNFRIYNNTGLFKGKIHHYEFTVNSMIKIDLNIAYDVFKYEVIQRYHGICD